MNHKSKIKGELLVAGPIKAWLKTLKNHLFPGQKLFELRFESGATHYAPTQAKAHEIFKKEISIEQRKLDDRNAKAAAIAPPKAA